MAAGKHFGDKQLSEAAFLKHYKVCQDSTHAVMFVMTMATRQGKHAASIGKLVTGILKSCPNKPILFVVTSASGGMSDWHESDTHQMRVSELCFLSAFSLPFSLAVIGKWRLADRRNKPCCCNLVMQMLYPP